MKRMIRDSLESQFGTGDPDLLQGFYKEYQNNMTDGIAALKQQLAGEAPWSLVKKAHTLKGLALIIGDQDLAAPLLDFEHAALDGNLKECRKLLPELERGLRLLQDRDE